MTEVLRILGERKIGIAEFPLDPERLAELVELQAEGTISSRIAKELFAELLTTSVRPSTLVAERGMVQVSDTDYLVQLVERAIDENPDTLEKYRAGKTAVLGFLVGQVMKYSQGKANPERVRVLLLERLGSTDTLAR